jgi:hypothetical protein
MPALTMEALFLTAQLHTMQAFTSSSLKFSDINKREI